jgi:hypothetical protein
LTPCVGSERAENNSQFQGWIGHRRQPEPHQDGSRGPQGGRSCRCWLELRPSRRLKSEVIVGGKPQINILVPPLTLATLWTLSHTLGLIVGPFSRNFTISNQGGNCDDHHPSSSASSSSLQFVQSKQSLSLSRTCRQSSYTWTRYILFLFKPFAIRLIPPTANKMGILSFVSGFVAPLFIILSPITSYADQILSIHRNKTSAGFSLDIPLIMLVASMFR